MESTSQSMAWLARRDGSVLIGHGPFQASHAPPPGGVAFYVQNFAPGESYPWQIPHHFERTSLTEFAAQFTLVSNVAYEWEPLGAAPFSEVFQEILISIHRGGVEKTVPVVTEIGHSNQAPDKTIIAAMARRKPPLQSYGWVHPNAGFAGATPELLFSLDGRKLVTMALAGTAKIDDLDVFAVDQKEIREHEYVAQTLVSKLLDLGNLTRHSRQILELGSIVHFLTRIEVDLHAEMDPQSLLRRLHPTPALGPLPRTDETMASLLEWRDRLGCPPHFGSPFGLWDQGRFDAVVAIRGIWWEGTQLKIPAGCGIIEASRLVNEWRELRLKREAVKCCLEFPVGVGIKPD